MASIQILETADHAALAAFADVIDVRSPAEFAEDHLPGAVNLPVLTNAQRAEVGTIYVQESRFKASRIGAAYVARNIAHHLETALAERTGEFHPLIYCWRGGTRSNAMAIILSQVGWRASVLQGGYKTYRRHVKTRLYDEAPPLKLVLLDGHTGSGKTAILAHLAAAGVQVLDLEGLAGHRGSLFGGFAGQDQPSQKMFESRLLTALEALDPARPVVVEAESSKIGERMNPPALWGAMLSAPRVELIAPREVRASYLVAAYADITANRAALEAAFARLPTHPGQKRLEDWRALADAGEFAALAEALMELHYDPAYDRSSRKDTRRRLGVVTVDALDEAGQAAAARQVAQLVAEAF